MDGLSPRAYFFVAPNEARGPSALTRFGKTSQCAIPNEVRDASLTLGRTKKGARQGKKRGKRSEGSLGAYEPREDKKESAPREYMVEIVTPNIVRCLTWRFFSSFRMTKGGRMTKGSGMRKGGRMGKGSKMTKRGRMSHNLRGLHTPKNAPQ